MRILKVERHPKAPRFYLITCGVGLWLWKREVTYKGPYEDGSWWRTEADPAPERHRNILNAYLAVNHLN